MRFLYAPPLSCAPLLINCSRAFLTLSLLFQNSSSCEWCLSKASCKITCESYRLEILFSFALCEFRGRLISRVPERMARGEPGGGVRFAAADGLSAASDREVAEAAMDSFF